LPNPFGLFDVHGNVREWVGDRWGSYTTSVKVDPTGPSTGSNRVGRGGSWYVSARLCRSAVRFDASPIGRWNDRGFRLARSL